MRAFIIVASDKVTLKTHYHVKVKEFLDSMDSIKISNYIREFQIEMLDNLVNGLLNLTFQLLSAKTFLKIQQTLFIIKLIMK